MWQAIKTAWTWAKGKKTATAGALIIAAQVARASGNVEAANAIEWLASGLAVVGLADKGLDKATGAR